MKKKPAAKPEPSDIPIREIRHQRVLLDSDLAAIYGVTTKRLNEQFRRNRQRFPDDFVFQLTEEEAANLRSQTATSSDGNRSQIATASPDSAAMRSQNVTASKRSVRHLPFAFTEHGALQVDNILKSERAAAMSVFVNRAFIQMREQIVANAAILQRLAEIDNTLLDHDHALRTVWMQLQPLLAPPPELPKPKIGFKP